MENKKRPILLGEEVLEDEEGGEEELGKLFEWGSSNVVEMRKGQPFWVQGHLVSAKISRDCLQLTKSTKSNDAQKQHKDVGVKLKGEKKALEARLVSIKTEITIAQEYIEAGRTLLLEELGKLLVEKGTTTKRLAEFKSMGNNLEGGKYTYTETNQHKSLLLEAGSITDISALLPGFSLPVMWCPTNPTFRIEEIKVEKEGSGEPAHVSTRNKFAKMKNPSPGITLSLDYRTATVHSKTTSVYNILGSPCSRYSAKYLKSRADFGWAPPTLKGTIYQRDTCGFYLTSAQGTLYSQAGDNGTKANYYCNGIGIGQVVTSVYDEEARTITFKVGSKNLGICFRGVPTGLQPAFLLTARSQLVFTDEE